MTEFLDPLTFGGFFFSMKMPEIEINGEKT